MEIVKRGLRLQNGYAPVLDEWYPLIADIFAERFWLIPSAGDYNSPLVRLWNEDESLFDEIWVSRIQPDREDYSLFRPESMTQYLRYHHHFWWQMYGVGEESVPKLQGRMTQTEMIAFLMHEADPIMLNPEDAWWEVFSDKIDLVAERLRPTGSIALSDIVLTERRLFTYGLEE